MVALLVAQPSASAHDDYDNMVPTNNGLGGFNADNFFHNFWVAPGTWTGNRNAIYSRMQHLEDLTVMEVSEHPAPQFSAPGLDLTDIVFYQVWLDVPWAGHAFCNVVGDIDIPNDRVECSQFVVRVNQYRTQHLNWAELLTVVCHEIGHAVGLTHGLVANPSIPDASLSLACMRNGTVNPAWNWLGAHNAHQITAEYFGDIWP